jgi:hypothetical protein
MEIILVRDTDISASVPVINLSKWWKGVCYTGIKLFSNLSPGGKSLNHHIELFKVVLKESLSLSLSLAYSVELTSLIMVKLPRWCHVLSV